MARKLPIGSKLGKVWGWTRAIFQSESTEVQHLQVTAGWKCSEHHHKHKANLFYVLRGDLIVRVYKDGLWDETVLGPGEMTSVRPGDEHQFVAKTDCELIEIYHVTLDPDDITRSTQGGPCQAPTTALPFPPVKLKAPPGKPRRG